MRFLGDPEEGQMYRMQSVRNDQKMWIENMYLFNIVQINHIQSFNFKTENFYFSNWHTRTSQLKKSVEYIFSIGNIIIRHRIFSMSESIAASFFYLDRQIAFSVIIFIQALHKQFSPARI